MPDIVLEQGGAGVPVGTQTTYRELADGTYALVVTLAEAEIAQFGGRAPAMDSVTDAQVVIAVPHHEVHEGEMFVSSYKTDDGSPPADNAAIMVHILTGPLLFPHFTFQVSAGGDAEMQFYQGMTRSINGTELDGVSLNRVNVGTATVRVWHTPTVTNDGAQLLTLFLPGGTQPRAGGGVIRADTEWVLKRNTRYLIRLTNRSGGGQPLGIAMTWYEESDQ